MNHSGHSTSHPGEHDVGLAAHTRYGTIVCHPLRYRFR